MISTDNNVICKGCGRSVDEPHVMWQDRDGSVMHFHLTCALFMSKVLLNSAYDVMRMKRAIKEGHQDNVTDAR